MKKTTYLLLTRLWNASFATYHRSFESAKREISLIEKEHNLKLNFIDASLLDEECAWDAYPDGTAIAVPFDISYKRHMFFPVSGAQSVSDTQPTIEYPVLASEKMEQGVYAGNDETYVSPFSGKVS